MDVNVPLKRLMNEDNVLDKIAELDTRTSPENSEYVDSSDDISLRTGTQVVDELIAPAPDVEVLDPEDSTFYGAGITGGGRTFGSEIMNFWAVGAGILQVGFNNLGKLIFGAGAGSLSVDGIELLQGNSTANKLKWVNAGSNEVYVLETLENSGSVISRIFSQGTAANPIGALIVSAFSDGGNPAGITFSSLPAGQSYLYINNENLDVDTYINWNDSTPALFVRGSDGFIGVNNTSPTEQLHVDGNILATGTVVGSNNLGDIVLESNAEDIFRVNSPGGVSAFAGTINGTPSGASVVYNVTSGQEAAMVPVSTGHLAKLVLYNTTRGNSALISNCNTGTNTITLTANAPANWANTDVITIASQTVSGGGFSWCDIQFTSGPTGKAGVGVNMTIQSATPGDVFKLHPFEAFGSGNISNVVAQVNGINNEKGTVWMKTTSSTLSIAWTGTPTTVILRENAYQP